MLEEDISSSLWPPHISVQISIHVFAKGQRDSDRETDKLAVMEFT